MEIIKGITMFFTIIVALISTFSLAADYIWINDLEQKLTPMSKRIKFILSLSLFLSLLMTLITTPFLMDMNFFNDVAVNSKPNNLMDYIVNSLQNKEFLLLILIVGVMLLIINLFAFLLTFVIAKPMMGTLYIKNEYILIEQNGVDMEYWIIEKLNINNQIQLRNRNNQYKIIDSLSNKIIIERRKPLSLVQRLLYKKNCECTILSLSITILILLFIAIILTKSLWFVILTTPVLVFLVVYCRAMYILYRKKPTIDTNLFGFDPKYNNKGANNPDN